MYCIEHAWLLMKASTTMPMQIEDEVKEHLPNVGMSEVGTTT
jgi:hypothetical protein